MKWINLPTEPGRNYFYMSNLGNDYYFSSYNEGKEGRIVHFSVDFTKAKHITTTFQDLKPQETTKDDVIIPERKNSTMITSLSFDTDKIYVRYSFNDVPLFIIFDLSNRTELLEYPVKYPSSLMDVQGYPFGTTLYFYGAAFNTPIRLYVYEWLSDSFNNPAILYYQAENDYLHPFDYTIEKRWVPSTNGVEIPIFLLYRNGLQLDGSSPLVLNIYGAYGMNLYPVYDNEEFVLVHDYNSILCFAGIRGGDDHGGEEWHLAAINGSKQNSIDDTFSVAKYLIEQNFTSKGKIILDGMGAGATTASIVINQDLENYFGFLFIKRGIMDLLRFNDQDDQISFYRIDEYGNPGDPKAFDWLKRYSPIHNINKNKIYPITTIRPGLESDENPAWQSYKYLASLQSSLPTNVNPFFLIEADISNDEAAAVVVSIIVHSAGIKKVNH